MSKLLEGIRVIESAALFNGDHAGMLLGDLGADVIKVESPFRGDYLRDFLGQIVPHHSPAHVQVNKNKRSVAIDLRNDDGRELFWRLLATADVFVDGNAADACAQLGIGYEAQRSRKADIIYCQVSGFGARGAYAALPTHGQMMNALAAAMPQEVGPDGFARERKPERLGGTTMAGDGTANAGVYAAYHVAAALVRRARTGQGCYIDVSGADACIAAGWIGAIYDLNDHRITDRRGMPSVAGGESRSAKYQFYETSDGRFVLFCSIEHKFWDNFCRAIGRDDLREQKDTARPVDFAVGDAPLRSELRAIFRTRTLEEWMRLAVANDICMGPAATNVTELLDDPHMRERGILLEGEHPVAGPFTYVGPPAVVPGQPFEVRRPAPLLGEHTAELLAEIGCSREDIRRLAERKIVGGAQLEKK